MSLNRWIGDLTDEQITCRDTTFGHDWQKISVSRDGSGFKRLLACARCDTGKMQTLDRKGYVVANSIRYGEGYLRPKGSGRMTREDNARLRLSSLKRELSE